MSGGTDIAGVILAGGRGTRLRPCTIAVNKHLLPVHDRPMVCWGVRALLDAGVPDIGVVTNAGDVEVFRAVLAESFPGVRIELIAQEQAGGVAHALGCAERFVNGRACAVLLGDNVFGGSLGPVVRAWRESDGGGVLVVREVEDVAPFGAARVEGDRVVEVEEKPSRGGRGLAVLGFYVYGSGVFEVIRRTPESERGELEISAVNDALARSDGVRCVRWRGGWADAGTFEGLREAARVAATRDREDEGPPG